MEYISESIDINNKKVGEIQGILTNKEDNHWQDYLYREMQDGMLLDSLIKNILECKNIQKIAILHYIEVLESHRGKGLGNNLIEQFHDMVEEAEVTIVVADVLKTQKPFFRLIDWYENKKYMVLDIQHGTVVMIKTDVKELLKNFKLK